MITRKFLGKVCRTNGETVNVLVKVALEYDEENDPLAVSMIISVPDEGDVTWSFALELLEQGSKSLGAVGSGDVGLRMSGSTLIACLKNRSGHADLLLPLADVRDFVHQALMVDQDIELLCEALVDDFLEELFEA